MKEDPNVSDRYVRKEGLPTVEPTKAEHVQVSGLGVELIADERRRQIAAEGWTPEHDAEHVDQELARAAVCYVEATYGGVEAESPWDWPWGMSWWKPSDDPIRNLAKAGALIAAEIDRLQRMQP